MKKILFCLISMVLMSTTMFAVKSESKVADGVSAVHDDFVSSVSTLYNDGKSAAITVYNDSKELAEVLYPEVKAAIVSIASAIGVATEHVYKVLVMKYVVDGVKELFLFVVALVLLIVGIHYLKKRMEESPSTWRTWPSIACVIAAIICFCCVDYNTMFMGLINPEYGALNYILDFTKTLIK